MIVTTRCRENFITFSCNARTVVISTFRFGMATAERRMKGDESQKEKKKNYVRAEIVDRDVK